MAQAVEAPQAVEPGFILKPTFNVVSVAELEGSSYLLSSDGKGYISCWDVSPDNENMSPIHYAPAHEEGVNQVLLLRSNRIPEVIEANEWDMEERRLLAKEKVKAKAKAKKSKVSPEKPGSKDTPLESRGEHDEEVAGAEGEAIGEGLPEVEDEEEEEEENEQGRRSLLERCFPCLGMTTGIDNHWLVATAAEDGCVRIWRWRRVPKRYFNQNEEEHCPLEVDFITEWKSEPKAPVQKCLELYDGHLAVALKDSNDVRVIDPSTSTLKWVLFGHTKPVTCLAESADGRLVSGACDGAVRLWDRKSWLDKAQPMPAKDQLQRTADSGFVSEPPAAPAVDYEDPSAQSPVAGVCTMAFFAHMQQAQRGECASMCLRVLIQSCDNLPKADTLSLSDPYVVCTLLDGIDTEKGVHNAYTVTPESRTGEWNHDCQLAIQKQILFGTNQLPAASFIDFEVVVKGKLWHFSRPDKVLARCSMSLEKVLADIAKDPQGSKTPSAHKLYSPLGEGPRKELKDALLFLGFSRNVEDTINLTIGSTQGLKLPFGGIGQTMYVRAKVRQSSAAKVNRLPAKVRGQTMVKPNTVNPYFNEVLEFQVPAFIGDRHVSISPEYFLHFEIWDQDVLLSDDFLAELMVPVTEAFSRDGEPAKPYYCTLAEGRASYIDKKRAQSPAGQGDSWEAKGDRNRLSQMPQAPGEEVQPRICLGFQTITPSPKQLKCTVDRVEGLTSAGAKEGLEVSMRWVEGNPLMPAETAVQTSWKRQTLKPVWKERCVLEIPKELREMPEDDGKPWAVRKAWMHESRNSADTIAVCVDIYDRDPVLGRDEYICRGSMSFMTAYTAAMDGSGSRPRPISLSCSSSARLFLGFEIGPAQDTLVVYVSHAENLEPRDITGLSDPFCVVRFAHLSQLGEPTDEADFKGLGRVSTGMSKTGAVRGEVRWDHTEILEVPGAFQDGLLAARSNWHLQLDVVNPKNRVVMGSAHIPVAEVFDQVAGTAVETKSNTMLSITERLEDIRSPFRKQSERDLFADEFGCQAIQRRLPLHQFDRPRKQALGKDQAVSSSDRATTPSSRPFGNASESLGSALVALGIREETKRKDFGFKNVFLRVRFEVVSRWKGLGRGTRAPPSQPMPGPSPVTCMAVLAHSIVAGHEDGNVFVWDSSDRSSVPLHQFQAHRVPVSAIAVLAPLGCVVTAGEVRNKEEAASDSLLRLWSSVNLELRQSLSLHGAVARCLSPLALGAGVDQIMQAAEAMANAEGKAREKVMEGLPPCLAIGTNSRQANHLQLMKVHFS